MCIPLEFAQGTYYIDVNESCRQRWNRQALCRLQLEAEKMGYHLRRWLANIRIIDPVVRQQALLLQIILIVIVLALGLALVFSMLLLNQAGPRLNVLAPKLLLLLCIASALIILRRGQFQAALGLAIAGLLLEPAYALLSEGVLNNPGPLLLFCVPIALAGILLYRHALMLVATTTVLIVAGVFWLEQVRSTTPLLETFVVVVLALSLISLLLDYVGREWRAALVAARTREQELQREMSKRQEAETELRFRVQLSAIIGLHDSNELLTQIADLIVQQLADWCVIDLVDGDGRLQRVVTAARDPALAKTVAALCNYPPQADQPGGISQVFQHGIVLDYLPPFDAASIFATNDRTALHLLAELGVAYVICVPLYANAHHYGVLTLVRRVATPVSARQRTLISDVARRVALALDHFWLSTEAFAQRQHFEVILGSIGDAVIATDANGHISFMNQVASTLTGWSLAEAMGRHLDEVFVIVNESDWTIVESPFARAIRHNSVVGLPTHTMLIARDGRPIPIDDSCAPISNAQGKLRGVVVVFHDITTRRRDEQGLLDSEQRFRSMADSAPVLLWMSDTTGACTFFNQPWLAFTGRTLQEELGDGWATGVHPDDYDFCMQTYTAAFQARQPFVMDYRLRRADGKYRWVQDNGIPHFAPDGSFMGYIGSCIDITERKHVEEQQRLLAVTSDLLGTSLDYATTLRNVAQILVPTIADYCLLYSLEEDGYYRQVVGMHRDPHKQTLLDELGQIYRIDPDSPHSLVMQVIRTRTTIIGMQSSEADARRIVSDSRILEIYRALNPTSYIVVPLIVRDVVRGTILLAMAESGRRYSEEDRAVVTEIAQRCALAIENARLYLDAQRAIRTRDQFMTIASHELKTPLTSIIGFTSLILRRHERDAVLNERDARALQMVMHQSTRLNQLVSLLLDMGRIETGQLQIEPALLDIVALMRRTIEQVQLAVDRHTLTIDTAPATLMVMGDELRLEQVFQNLLYNAVKYSPLGGPVRVTITQSSDTVEIQVRDRGIGIPAAAQPHIFERFYRASNVNAQHISGMGVGLYVAREIVNRHGGSIAVQSTEGMGSTFTVMLPLLAPPSV